MKGMFTELNFRKKKLLLCYSYNPNKITVSDHLEILRRNLDLYFAQYENLIMIGDQGIIQKKYGRIGFWQSQKRLQLGTWG